jgi:hypothetical protein
MTAAGIPNAAQLQQMENRLTTHSLGNATFADLTVR